MRPREREEDSKCSYKITTLLPRSKLNVQNESRRKIIDFGEINDQAWLIGAMG